MREFSLVLFWVLLVSCGKVDPKAQVALIKAESDIKTTTEQYNSALASFQGAAKANLANEIAADRKLSLLVSLKVRDFLDAQAKLPGDAQSLAKAIGDIPQEIISGSSRLSYEKDENGGWYFDKKTNTVSPNLSQDILPLK